ncbi:MAG TPA: pyruvate kinase, partial [Chlamydiales bacterium]|nr:pyruvate kinase [Chlamydiales bacterium]
VCIEIENHGHVTSSKGVNIPNVELPLPSITETDLHDIQFGISKDVDAIAVSFVRSPETILTIKKMLVDAKKPDIQVFAKIENAKGVENFDSILQVADGIMVARGDLGVEVPLSEVPRLQKMMIRKCYLAGKPVVTATQMLESMITNPRPTRAEVSDVANAIYDSSSSVMLSGETAIGKYPFEAVRIMKSIIIEAENDFNYSEFFDLHTKMTYTDVPSGITLASVKTAYSLGAKAIFTFTTGGTTARLIARLRPSIPIIALTSNERTYQQLAMNWGITPMLCKNCTTLDQAFKEASHFALDHHIVSYGDLVVLTAGSPFLVPGTTNMIVVESIGDVLVRGHGGKGSRKHANITLVPIPEQTESYQVKGKIIVISRCTEETAPLFREACGIILENHHDDTESEKNALMLAKTVDKPVILRADGAFRILREGQLVTLDPEKSLVYKGVVN